MNEPRFQNVIRTFFALIVVSLGAITWKTRASRQSSVPVWNNQRRAANKTKSVVY